MFVPLRPHCRDLPCGRKVGVRNSGSSPVPAWTSWRMLVKSHIAPVLRAAKTPPGCTCWMTSTEMKKRNRKRCQDSGSAPSRSWNPLKEGIVGARMVGAGIAGEFVLPVFLPVCPEHAAFYAIPFSAFTLAFRIEARKGVFASLACSFPPLVPESFCFWSFSPPSFSPSSLSSFLSFGLCLSLSGFLLCCSIPGVLLGDCYSCQRSLVASTSTSAC